MLLNFVENVSQLLNRVAYEKIEYISWLLTHLQMQHLY